MKYNIMNADMLHICGIRPSLQTRGDVFVLPTQVEACPWLPGDKLIPAGTYRITSRKRFRGGSQEIEKA